MVFDDEISVAKANNTLIIRIIRIVTTQALESDGSGLSEVFPLLICPFGQSPELSKPTFFICEMRVMIG